jgi:hypothetical protein
MKSEKYSYYLQLFQSSVFPEDAEGIGTFMNQENQPMVALGFKTHRDIITNIGVRSYDADCPEELKVCLGVVLEYALDNSVMSAHTITPQLIAERLELEELPESAYIFAVLAIYTLKDAISNYALLRKDLVAEFQKAQ